MSMDSPMLGSVYSRVKELLRNTLSKYKGYKIEEEGNGIGVIGIGEGKRENIRERRT